TRVESERQMLQLREHVRSQVVSHTLAEADAEIGVEQARSPTQQKDQHRPRDTPKDEGIYVAARKKRIDLLKDRTALVLQNIADQENHRPRLQHIKGRLYDNADDDQRDISPAPKRIADCPKRDAP